MANTGSKLILPLRVVQGVFAIIILGTLAYAADAWNYYGSPSEVNFVIFASVWTLLALAYLVIAPAKFPVAAHHFAIFAVEAITLIFWFAGFIALAVLLTAANCSAGSRRYWGYWGPCRAAIAGNVFAAFEWLLFCATAALAGLFAWKNRNATNTTKHNPETEVRV